MSNSESSIGNAHSSTNLRKATKETSSSDDPNSSRSDTSADNEDSNSGTYGGKNGNFDGTSKGGNEHGGRPTYESIVRRFARRSAKKPFTIVFTGLSVGGANAGISSLYFAQELRRRGLNRDVRIMCVTFGAPSVRKHPASKTP